jgi:hypothetical protein
MSCYAEAPYALVANDSPLSVADDTSDDNADDRHTSQHLQLHRRARVSVLSIFDLVYSVVPGECIGSRNAEWPRGDRLGSVSGLAVDVVTLPRHSPVCWFVGCLRMGQ